MTAQHPHPLSAPQATLMGSLAKGVFGGDLPWGMVAFGALIAAVVIVWDHRQQGSGKSFRVPILAFALGIYLPFKLSTAILLGGLLAHLVTTRRESDEKTASQQGLLCAAGLVTGEALTGIALAIPIALSGVWPSVSPDPFMIFEAPPFGGWPGLAILAGVSVWLYRNATQSVRAKST
jgi:putative OPT family oligopeptide transporter